MEQIEKRIENLNTVKGIHIPFRNEAAFCELVGLLQPHLLRKDAGKPIKANEHTPTSSQPTISWTMFCAITKKSIDAVNKLKKA